MRRRILLAGLSLVAAARARATELWALAIPDEVRRENDARPPPIATRGLTRPSDPETPSSPGAPEIVVDQPNAAATLHPPLSFRVRFVPAPGTTIDPRSFRASYGMLGIDITTRLLRYARLSEQGLSADNMDIAASNHQVRLTIADSRGREVSRVFRFTVA
jgi:hypothetical protein